MGHNGQPDPVRLLAENPRVFWGKVIKVLIERGWSPPPPDERIVDDLLHDMQQWKHVRHGVEFVPPTMAHELNDRFDLLTKREKSIVALLPTGMSNDQIAAHLEVAPQTVKFHLTNVYRKLEAKSRAQVVGMLLQQQDRPSG